MKGSTFQYVVAVLPTCTVKHVRDKKSEYNLASYSIEAPYFAKPAQSIYHVLIVQS